MANILKGARIPLPTFTSQRLKCIYDYNASGSEPINIQLKKNYVREISLSIAVKLAIFITRYDAIMMSKC
jgi:hypothetical protein